MTETLRTFKNEGTGVSYQGYSRDGTNDHDCITGCACDYLFDKLIPNPGTGICIDVGAHIGGATLALLSQGYTLRSVEAIPSNADLLWRNVCLNEWNGRVLLYNMAIGADDGTPTAVVIDCVADPTSSQAMHRFIGSTCKKASESELQPQAIVPSVSLATVIGDAERIELLKMDCEGAERAALTACPTELLDRIQVVVAELHLGWTNAECAALFPNHDNVTGEYGMNTDHYIILRKKAA